MLEKIWSKQAQKIWSEQAQRGARGSGGEAATSVKFNVEKRPYSMIKSGFHTKKYRWDHSVIKTMDTIYEFVSETHSTTLIQWKVIKFGKTLVLIDAHNIQK